MTRPSYPLLDDHIHIDPLNGRGLEAVKDFQRAGGTHICLVTKPSWSFGIEPSSGDDWRRVFDETLSIADRITEIGIRVFPLLGVHPAEITRLGERMELSRAEEVMKEGLSLAAGYVREERAIGLKSGRPHYPVSEEIWAASNRVLSHAFLLGAECGCSVQVHAETGPCSDMVAMAEEVSLPPGRVIKHFGTPETPLSLSMLARDEAIPDLCRGKRLFTMESDYMDENDRPGAVIGPKSVPRFTHRLLEHGLINEDDIYRMHQQAPEKMYGIEVSL